MVGPGSYENPKYFGHVGFSTIYKKTPNFSFGQDIRKNPKVCSPGPGTYSPGYRQTFQKGSSYPIGTSPQDDRKTYKNIINRSPGPIYKYNLKSDLSSEEKLNKVVVQLNIK